MTFLPIVERELRVRARLRSTFQFRLFAAIAAILLVIVLLFFHGVVANGTHLGAGIFKTLAGLALFYCLMEGARNTADSLSREKREGTLGLLFLTDLRGYDVVIGKLVATSINSLYGLLAIFPALAVPLVLGGITVGEFWRHVLCLLNALFVSLTIGLFISTVCRDERKTWGLTTLIMLLLTAGPPFLLTMPSSSFAVLAMFSPFTAFLGAFDGPYNHDPSQYWDSIRATQGIAWLALIGASALLPRLWHDQPIRAAKNLAPTNRRAVARLQRRRNILDSQPTVWLAARSNQPPIALWIFVLASVTLALFTWGLNLQTPSISLTLFLAMLAVHLVLSIWVAAEACHVLAEARDSGALDLLLCTSLPTREIIRGYLHGIRRIFFRPVAFLLVVELIIIAGNYYIFCNDNYLHFAGIIMTGGVLLFMLMAVFEMQAAATLGLWNGLTNRRPAQAVAKTVMYVILLPLLGFFCYPIYPILGLVKNLVFINYAHDQLRRQFRNVLAERFDTSKHPEYVSDPPKRAARGQLPPVLPL